MKEIDDLIISNAIVSNSSRSDKIFIDYIINGIHFYLTIFKNKEEKWVPSFIHHYVNKEEEERFCPFCNKRLFISSCDSSDKYINTIYQNLLKLPSVKIRVLVSGLINIKGEE